MKTKGRPILLIGVMLFSFMLISLLLMSLSLEDSERFGNLYSYLLVFNTLGLIVLVVLIVLNFKRLARELRNRIPGSLMTVRMVMMFSILSITPVLIVYYFSLDFLLRGIDNWFDLRVEQALDDSLELSRVALDIRMRDLLKQTEQIAEEMSDTSDAAVPFEIDGLRQRTGAEELTLITRQGGIISSSIGDSLNLVPDRPDETILLQLQQGNSYVGLDPIKDTGLYIRVVVNMPEVGGNPPRIIQALFPIAERMNQLAESVQSAFVEYKELSYLREQLKLSFVMILTMVLLFSIFSVVWAAFYSAKKLASPVRDLAEGTKAVAAGDYNTQLPVTSKDELGFLVASFNEMTQKISQARDDVQRSQQQAEAQHTYLETVLVKLSSGVITFDKNRILRTVNESAAKILGVTKSSIINQSMDDIRQQYRYLDHFLKVIEDHLQEPKDWREQITIFGTSGRQVLMCSGAALPSIELTATGYVIVFDDITALLQGQKDAAWSEVARRLAHEIKNPLTPIQLAAERLRHKYLATMNQTDAETLDRLTNTIVQQVKTMKDMVNTFSDYARTPTIELQVCDLNQLLQEVLDLYSNYDETIKIKTDFAINLPLVQVDANRLRQVFNNLIKNALEVSPTNSTLEISTHRISDLDVDSVEIRIRDSGTGITDDLREKLFDPYVSTKTKGTGLGLAIVKKIIEEHGGIVWLENNEPAPGACAYIRLPIENTSTVAEKTSHKQEAV